MALQHSRHRDGTGTRVEGWKAVEGWKTVVAVLAGWWHRVSLRVKAAASPRDGERGDVPGWVMITLVNRTKSHRKS